MTSIIEFILSKLFIYFILAIITCSLVEIVLTSIKARSTVLSHWLFRTFDKSIQQADGRTMTLAQAIIDHTIITGLSKSGQGPSYISPKNFSTVLLEKISFEPDDPKKAVSWIDEIINNLKRTPLLSTELTRVFLQYAYEAKENESVVKETKYFRAQIESWFNSSMDQLTGSFKVRFARSLTILMATLIICALNVDSILFVKMLYSNPKEPATQSQPMLSNSDSNLLQMLSLFKPASQNDSIILAAIKEQVNINKSRKVDYIVQKEKLEQSESFSIGWNIGQLKQDGRWSVVKIIVKVLGLLSTILIIILLAPFLFDIGNKYSNVRGTGPKPTVELAK